jgi:hypothetical protein
MARLTYFVRTLVGVVGLWGEHFAGVVKITFCMSILIIVRAASVKFVAILATIAH